MKRFVAVYLVISILMTQVLYSLMGGGMAYAGSLESAGHSPFMGGQPEVFGHMASLVENPAVATTAPSLRLNLDASLIETTGPGLKINLETFRPIITSAKANPDSTVSLEWPVYKGYEFTEIEINEEVFGTTAASSFVHKQVLPSQSYEYRIRAYYDGVYTSWSDVVTVVTDEPLMAPGFLDTVTSGPSLVLHWQFPEDRASAVRYDVFANGASLGSTTDRHYVLPDSGGDYLLKVRALVNGTYFTEFSAPLIIGDVTVENYSVSTANKDVYKAGFSYAMHLDEHGHVWTWGDNENRQLGIGHGKNDVPKANIPVRVKNLSNIVKIFAGYQTGFAVDANGTLYGWGANSKNQMGLNSPWNMATPATMPLLGSSVKSIDSGQHHTVALMEDGKIYVFGANNHGQLGTGSTSALATPQILSPGIPNATSVHCGRYSTYILTSDGKVYSFGRNNKGQLGLGHTNSTNTPTLISGLANVVALDARAEHVLAYTTAGQLYVFGRNNEFQLGLGDNGYHTSPTLNSAITDIKAMDTTYTNSFFIKNNGDIVSAGRNSNYELGAGDSSSRTTPQTILNLPTADALNSVFKSGSVVLTDDTVYLWGNQSTYNEFGIYGPADLATPQNIGQRNFNNTAYVHNVGITNEKAAYEGNETITLVTDYASRVYNESLTMTMSIDGNGVLSKPLSGHKPGLISRTTDTISLSNLSPGNHTISVSITGSKSGTATYDKPLTVASNILSFNRSVYASGKDYLLYLDGAGDVWAWGNNAFGQLGSGKDGASLSRSDVPIKVKGLSNIASVHAGYGTAFAIGEDGKLYGWGHNALGQLGLGNDRVNKAEPTEMSIPGTHIVAIDAGYGHTAVLMKDGTLYTFGSNDYGQLGNGTTTDLFIPTILATAIANPVSVHCGKNATYVLTAEGKVYSFGKNTTGELGHGTTTDVSTPTQITGLSNIKKLETLAAHVLAVDTTGNLYAFGHNDHGQLGVETPTFISTPTKVTGISAVKDMKVGEKNSLIALVNGNIITMGDNQKYQLGIGADTLTKSKQTITTIGDVAQLLVTSDTMALVRKSGGYLVWGDDSVNHEFGNPTSPVYKVPTDIGPRFFDVTPYLYTELTQVKSSYKSTETLEISSKFATRIDGETLNLRIFIDGVKKIEKAYTTPTVGSLIAQTSGVALSGLATGSHELKITVQGGAGSVKERTLNIVVEGIPVQKGKNFAAGLSYGLHLSESGHVWTWGDNENRQLGVDQGPMELPLAHVPVRVNNLANVDRIFAGYNTAFAIDKAGKLYGWGSNSKNQLGLNAAWNRDIPTLMPINGHQVVTIDSGQNHTAVLMADGSIYTFGNNNYGQLGNGTTTDVATPQKLSPGIPKAIAIHCGRYSTYVLTSDGKVYSFGRNNRGQLGHGHTRNVMTPTRVATLTDIVDLDTRAEHVVAVDNAGKLYVFGRNSEYQLGLGHNNYVTAPILNSGLTGVGHVDTTFTNTYVAKNNGEVITIGNNGNYELGIGHNNTAKSPQKILTLTEVENFNAIYNSGAVLTTGGNYYLWGTQSVYREFGLYNKGVLASPEDIGPRTFENVPYINNVSIVNKKSSYSEGDTLQLKTDYATVIKDDVITQTVAIDGVQVLSTQLVTGKIGVVKNHTTDLTLSGLTNGAHTISLTYDGTESDPVTVTHEVIVALIAPPSNLAITPKPLSADITFGAVDGATSYELEVDGKVVAINALKHTVNYLVPETTYKVRARTVVDTVKSEWSLPITFTTTAMDSALLVENFEKGISWQTMGDVILSKDAPKANEQKLVARGASKVIIPVSTEGYENIKLYAKLGAESLETSESLSLSWSDGGQGGGLIRAIDHPDADGQFLQIDVALPKAKNLKNFQLIFEIKGNAADDLGYLDDIVLTGTPFSSINVPTTQGKTLLIAVNGNHITKSGAIDVTLNYDPTYLRVVDLSAQTIEKNTTTGPVSGTTIELLNTTSPTIKFRRNISAFSGGYWKGTLNIIEFEMIRSGATTIIFDAE